MADAIQRCSVSDCDLRVHGHGLCRKHYGRFRAVSLSELSADYETTRSRLARRGRASAETGCLEWQGYVRPNGYGQTSFFGKSFLVHRVSWVLEYGAIPEGLFVLHRCDNRKCFAPDHLFLGTKQDNSQDMARKGRQWEQKKTHCPRGHPYSGANLYRWRNRRICRECRALRSRAKSMKVGVT